MFLPSISNSRKVRRTRTIEFRDTGRGLPTNAKTFTGRLWVVLKMALQAALRFGRPEISMLEQRPGQPSDVGLRVVRGATAPFDRFRPAAEPGVVISQAARHTRH
jgi:hypothetical protein